MAEAVGADVLCMIPDAKQRSSRLKVRVKRSQPLARVAKVLHPVAKAPETLQASQASHPDSQSGASRNLQGSRRESLGTPPQRKKSEGSSMESLSFGRTPQERHP